MQDASAVHDPAVGCLGGLDTQGKVLVQLLHQAVMDMTGGDELPFTPIKRRIVNREEHAHRRLIDGDGL